MWLIKVLCNPYFYIGFVIILLIVSKYIFEIDFMNIFVVFEMYMNNFKREDNKRIMKLPFFVYFIVPLILAISSANIKIADSNIINNITVVLSIFTSALFTLLTLIVNVKVKNNDNSDNATTKKISMLVKEIYYAIMFEIIVSVVLLTVTFIYMFSSLNSIYMTVCIYYLLFLFIANLLIILKRIFLIYEVLIK